MSKKVLCVDDDPHVLQALTRQYGRRFEIHTAVGCQQALMVLKEDGPFAVVISDLRMPGIDGIRFLSLVNRIAPDTVRVMLTGHGDVRSAVDAVNQARIFQFLTKPCPPERLAQTIESALEQHRLIVSERELQEKTLHGMVGVLSEILGLVSPGAFSRATRVRRFVQQMSEALKLKDTWQYELAAMLCHIGCVALPSDTLDRLRTGQALSNEEKGIISQQAHLGHDLLVRIPRLEKVAQMVLRQASPWSGDKEFEDPVRIGGQLLKAALDFDELLADGKATADAIEEMQQRPDYHPALKPGFRALRPVYAGSQTFPVSVSQLQPRMVTTSPVYARNNLMLVGAGQELAESAIARIKGFACTLGVLEPIHVMVPADAELNLNVQ